MLSRAKRFLPLAAFFFLSPALAAAGTSFSVLQTLPATVGASYAIAGAKVLPRLTASATGFTSYEFKPLQLQNQIADNTESIEHLAVVVPGFRFGVTNMWTTAIDFPLIAWEHFSQRNAAQPQRQRAFLGDLVFRNIVHLADSGSFSFALQPIITAPTGDSALRLGFGTFTGGGDGIIEYSIAERWKLTANLGARILPNVDADSGHSDDQLIIGGSGSCAVSPRWSLFLESSGRSPFDRFAERAHTVIDVMGGAHYQWRDWRFTAAAGRAFLGSIASPDARGVVGLHYAFSFLSRKPPPADDAVPEIQAPPPPAPPPLPPPSPPPRKPSPPRRFLPIS